MKPHFYLKSFLLPLLLLLFSYAGAIGAITYTATVVNVKCNGGATGSISLIPTGGTAPYSYKWSDGQTTSAATDLAAGTYSFTITDAHDLMANGSATITQPTTLLISGTASGTCSGTSNGFIEVIASGGTPGYTFKWNKNEGTSSEISSLAAGAYKVTVTDANKCTGDQSFTVTTLTGPNPSVSISSSTPGPICAGTEVTFTATPVNGGANPTFEWFVNGALNGNDSTNGGSTFTTAMPGGQTILVCVLISTAACVNPQSVADTIILAIPPNPSANAGPGGSICSDSGSGIKLGGSPTASGGTPPYTYKWTPNKDLTGGSTHANPVAKPTATTAYTITVKDANECSATSTATVSVGTPVTPSVTLTASPAGPVCSGTPITFTPAITNGGSSPTYLWYVNGTLAPVDTSAILSIPAGTIPGSSNMEVQVAITSNAVCATPHTVQNLVNVTVNPSPLATVTASGPTITCAASVKLTAPAGTGYKYAWSNNKTTQTITVKTSATYVVTVTGTDGCQAISSPEVVELKTLSIPPITYVNGDSLTPCDSNALFGLTVNDGNNVAYEWSNGASSETIDNLLPATYCVTVISSGTCTASECIDATCGANLAGKTASNADDDVYQPATKIASGMIVTPFPNPYSSNFHLNVLSVSDSNYNVAIYDLMGHLLEERNNVPYSSYLNLGDGYAASVYIVQVTQGDLRKAVKVVKAE